MTIVHDRNTNQQVSILVEKIAFYVTKIKTNWQLQLQA